MSVDHITPTYAAGTISINSGSATGDILNDSASGSGANGYTNNFDNISLGVARVGGYNSGWNNGCLTQSVTPVYANGLLSFGNTGRQS